jgi:hypothetical protein
VIAGGLAQVVECMPRQPVALCLNPSAGKKKKKKKRKRKRNFKTKMTRNKS